MAGRMLDNLPFDITKTVQKSGAHLITLLGMSSTLKSLQKSRIIQKPFLDTRFMRKCHGLVNKFVTL